MKDTTDIAEGIKYLLQNKALGKDIRISGRSNTRGSNCVIQHGTCFQQGPEF
jgi:hypothetical protein